MDNNERLRTVVDEVTKRLIEDGKLIEAGFACLRATVMAKDAPDLQVR